MGVRFPAGITFSQLNALPANATETLIFTTPPLTLPFDGAQVYLLANFDITAGTGTTGIILHFYRGPALSSPAIGGALPHTLAAGSSALLTIASADPVLAALAGVQYSLSVIQTGATAAGVVNGGSLMSFVL